MNSNLLSRPAGRPDILYFTPDFINSSVRDYKSAISDDDVLLLETECCDVNGQKLCSNEFYELAGTICTENNISVAQNVTEVCVRETSDTYQGNLVTILKVSVYRVRFHNT